MSSKLFALEGPDEIYMLLCWLKAILVGIRKQTLSAIIQFDYIETDFLLLSKLATECSNAFY